MQLPLLPDWSEINFILAFYRPPGAFESASSSQPRGDFRAGVFASLVVFVVCF